jgi:hypothetical protein
MPLLHLITLLLFYTWLSSGNYFHQARNGAAG